MMRHFVLSPDDAAEVQKWADTLGMERVARIMASLADPGGDTKPPMPETMLLLKIAHQVRERPTESLNSIVTEVVKSLGQFRNLGGESSLADELTRDFERRRHAWLSLAKRIGCPAEQEIKAQMARPKSVVEKRILGRLVALLPGAIDVYGDLLADVDAKERKAKEREDHDLRAKAARMKKLVKAFGRRRVEPLREEKLAQAMAGLVVRNPGTGAIARDFYGLIEPELEQFASTRPQASGGPAKRSRRAPRT
jgi:hypothetical protein